MSEEMKDVVVRVSPSFIRLLHVHAMAHREDSEIDVSEVLARVLSQSGMGIHPDVIYLSIPHMWRDDIEAVEQSVDPKEQCGHRLEQRGCLLGTCRKKKGHRGQHEHE